MSSMPGPGRSLGEGYGNSLQCSCLKNPMDGGAWRATVHGVTEDLDTAEQPKQRQTNTAAHSVESGVTWATPLSPEFSFTLYVRENMIRTCSS